MTKKQTPVQLADTLFHELRSLIEETRSSVAVTVNSALTMLYWRVGKRISKELLQGERAAYGAEILPTLSAKLSWSHFLSLIPPENYFLSHAKPRSREEKEKRKNEREKEKGLKMELHYIVFSCEVVPKATQKNFFLRVLRGFA